MRRYSIVLVRGLGVGSGIVALLGHAIPPIAAGVGVVCLATEAFFVYQEFFALNKRGAR